MPYCHCRHFGLFETNWNQLKPIETNQVKLFQGGPPFLSWSNHWRPIDSSCDIFWRKKQSQENCWPLAYGNISYLVHTLKTHCYHLRPIEIHWTGFRPLQTQWLLYTYNLEEQRWANCQGAPAAGEDDATPSMISLLKAVEEMRKPKIQHILPLLLIWVSLDFFIYCSFLWSVLLSQ